jgi:hypothetical protein
MFKEPPMNGFPESISILPGHLSPNGRTGEREPPKKQTFKFQAKIENQWNRELPEIHERS